MYMTEFSMDDLIFYSEDGQIKSGGYSVNSALLNQNMSPMVTINQSQQGGKNVSSPFENLAVPVGIYYLSQKFPKHEDGIHFKEHTPISDDVYDKLFELASFQKAKSSKKTKKSKQMKNKKTKKNMQ